MKNVDLKENEKVCEDGGKVKDVVFEDRLNLAKELGCKEQVLRLERSRNARLALKKYKEIKEEDVAKILFGDRKMFVDRRLYKWVKYEYHMSFYVPKKHWWEREHHVSVYGYPYKEYSKEIPYGALLKCREAEETNLFERILVFTPESGRSVDPLLVGFIDLRMFQIFAWEDKDD